MRVTPAPQNRRAAISSDELCDLYLTQGMTIEQIAAKFGLAATTISRRMRDLGIAARRRGPVPGTVFDSERSLGTKGSGWSPELAYAVGLIASDGCLGRDQSHITMTSKDTDLLETFRRCLGIRTRIGRTTNPRACYRLQWCDVAFHRWLTDIGLMPAKSLRLARFVSPMSGSEIFSAVVLTATGRSSRTSIVTTRSRRLATSTRACICRLSRRAHHSMDPRKLCNDSTALPAISASVDQRTITTSGAFDMRSARVSCFFAGCTTRQISPVSDASARLRRPS